MFVTKEIINSKLKKSLLPHKNQIFKEIQASQVDENWKIHNFYSSSRPKSRKNQQKRPNTAITIKSRSNQQKRPNTAITIKSRSNQQKRPNSAITIKSSTRKSTSTQFRTQTQQSQQDNTNYLRKINYQFNQITKISNIFDSTFDKKQKGIKKQSFLSEKVNSIKRIIRQKQKQQKQHYSKMKRVLAAKVTQTQPNIYIGYSHQNVKNTIPISLAKHQDMTMLTRYIKGGYVSEADEYSEQQNKGEVIKLKKRFLTMNTLYNAVKGKKNEGIQHLKPESVNRNTLQNYVYYLENQKTFKHQDKLAIQQKIKMVT